MDVWHKRFFESTRGRLVALLRRRELTVDEMASELGVTDNAVRAQLAALERDDMVEQRGVRRGAGKPSNAYGPTAEFEVALSRAYPPLLVHLIRELRDRLPKRELSRVMEAVGRRWAAELPTAPANDSLPARAAHAAALLAELGAAMDVEERNGRVALRGFGCPVGLAVKEHPRVCAAVEGLLAGVTGTKVREHCERSGRSPSCVFELGRTR